MQIDKLQLLILSILEEKGANAPGTGMTLREIANEVNKFPDCKSAQVTINKKTRALREGGYVDTKMKSNKADMYDILDKGINIKEVLINGN